MNDRRFPQFIIIGAAKAATTWTACQPWFEAVRGTMARPIRCPPFSDELRGQLCDYYREDIRQLEHMVGRHLDHWVVPPPSAAAKNQEPLMATAS